MTAWPVIRTAGWSDRLAPAAVALLCLLPLFLTPVLPSIDFYAHIVRYNVLAHPEAFAENYRPQWALLPNLGMDVIGSAILSVLPPLAGAKVVAALIILAPVLGTMALSRALHGRIDPICALLAGLLGYNLILFWGFSNFLLGTGVALASVGGWIAMRDRPLLQMAVAVPTGIVILFIHGMVFGFWGLMLATVELGLAMTAGPLRVAYLARRLVRLFLIALVPSFLFLHMRTSTAGGKATGSVRNLARIAREQGVDATGQRLWDELVKRMDSVLRVVETSDPMIDRFFGLVLWVSLALALRHGTFRLDRRLFPMATLFFALIWLMPPNLFGSGHYDERVPLLFLATVIAGLSRATPAAPAVAAPHWKQAALAVLFPLHILLVCWGMITAGTYYRGYIATISQLDTGRLGAAVFEGQTRQRDDGRHCKPLLFLLQLVNGTAVSTFANPTQQPLRFQGALAEVAGKSHTRNMPADEAVQTLLNDGFDTVVVCLVAEPITVPGARVLARGPGWAIYGREI